MFNNFFIKSKILSQKRYIQKVSTLKSTTKLNCETILEYPCTNNKCDFDKIYKTLSTSNLNYKDKQNINEIINVISSHQENYRPFNIDGYVFHKNGENILQLIRKDCNNNLKTHHINLEFYDNLRNTNFSNIQLVNP